MKVAIYWQIPINFNGGGSSSHFGEVPLYIYPYFYIYHKAFVSLTHFFLHTVVTSKMGERADATVSCIWSPAEQQWGIFSGMGFILAFLHQAASTWAPPENGSKIIYFPVVPASTLLKFPCFLWQERGFNMSCQAFCTLLNCFLWEAAFTHHWLSSFLFSFSSLFIPGENK